MRSLLDLLRFFIILHNLHRHCFFLIHIKLLQTEAQIRLVLLIAFQGCIARLKVRKADELAPDRDLREHAVGPLVVVDNSLD